MVKIAKEYMELMGIKDTLFLLVRHFDNGNPHCHLVYNRINNEGKTISDQNDFRRNEQVTKLLKRKYGLTFSKGKGRTKNRAIKGNGEDEIRDIPCCRYRFTAWQVMVRIRKSPQSE